MLAKYEDEKETITNVQSETTNTMEKTLGKPSNKNRMKLTDDQVCRIGSNVKIITTAADILATVEIAKTSNRNKFEEKRKVAPSTSAEK